MAPCMIQDIKKVKQKKRENKNKSNHKRRIKIDSVEYIILRRVLRREKRQMYASCIYVCLHWPSPTREKKFDENGVTNLQISLETILFEMVRTYIKILVFWKLAIVA